MMGIALIVATIVAQFLSIICAFAGGREYKTDEGDKATVLACIAAIAAPVLAYVAGGLS